MAVSGRKALQKFAISISRGSGEDFEVFCQPCDRDDLIIPVFGFCVDCEEHLCESCYNHHKRAKPLRHHTLLDKHYMPQSMQIPSSADPYSVHGDLTKPCSIHKKEIIKFYCNEHNTLLCSVCVTLNHPTTACHVNYIPDISVKTVNSKEYKVILKEIYSLISTVQDTATDLRKITEKSNASLTDVLTEIKKFRKEINQRLDVLEHEAENTAKALKQDNNERLKTTETACNYFKKVLQESSDIIKQLNTSKQADRLFMELKVAEQLIKENEKTISYLETPEDVKEFKFEPSLDISAVCENEKLLGTLTAKPLKSPRAASGTLKSKRFSHTSEVGVKTPKDKERCWITGMTLFTPDKLIVTDYNNKSIKMIDIKKNSLVDMQKLESYPWGVTIVSNEKLAVTLPREQKIQLLSVSFNKFTRTRLSIIRVDGTCFGIHCYKKQLIVLFQSPAKLRIIDMKGKVLKSISTNPNGEDIFRSPDHVTCNRNYIYVSDGEKKTVIELNRQGEVRGTFSGVGAPRGLAMLEDGTFLLCDSHNDHCNIQNISGDCMQSEVVLKDLKNPYAICWSEDNGTLYVSNFTNAVYVDNFIQIYKMTY